MNDKEKALNLINNMNEKQLASFISLFKGLIPNTINESSKNDTNVTRERVRQIEEKALRKLKNRARDLKDLVR